MICSISRSSMTVHSCELFIILSVSVVICMQFELCSALGHNFTLQRTRILQQNNCVFHHSATLLAPFLSLRALQYLSHYFRYASFPYFFPIVYNKWETKSIYLTSCISVAFDTYKNAQKLFKHVHKSYDFFLHIAPFKASEQHSTRSIMFHKIAFLHSSPFSLHIIVL